MIPLDKSRMRMGTGLRWAVTRARRPSRTLAVLDARPTFTWEGRHETAYSSGGVGRCASTGLPGRTLTIHELASDKHRPNRGNAVFVFCSAGLNRRSQPPVQPVLFEKDIARVPVSS